MTLRRSATVPIPAIPLRSFSPPFAESMKSVPIRTFPSSLPAAQCRAPPCRLLSQEAMPGGRASQVLEARCSWFRTADEILDARGGLIVEAGRLACRRPVETACRKQGTLMSCCALLAGKQWHVKTLPEETLIHPGWTPLTKRERGYRSLVRCKRGVKNGAEPFGLGHGDCCSFSPMADE